MSNIPTAGNEEWTVSARFAGRKRTIRLDADGKPTTRRIESVQFTSKAAAEKWGQLVMRFAPPDLLSVRAVRIRKGATSNDHEA